MGNLELITCLILSQTSKRQVIDIPVYPFNLKCYLCQHPEVLQLRLSMHLNYAQFVVIDFVSVACMLLKISICLAHHSGQYWPIFLHRNMTKIYPFSCS
jgi:hypothetical protein